MKAPIVASDAVSGRTGPDGRDQPSTLPEMLSDCVTVGATQQGICEVVRLAIVWERGRERGRVVCDALRVHV
jgi:hypothetical protein